MTDKDYFLQVGFEFEFGVGQVVWAGSKIVAGIKPDLRGHPFNGIPYNPGHVYYTTIAFTNEVWWTCAADNANPATYNCQPHPNAKGGRRLKNHLGTSVFAENWNIHENWHEGFTPSWQAFGARIYREGIGYPWSSEDAYTAHACKDKRWPREGAIK
jgi:hypothetical protein